MSWEVGAHIFSLFYFLSPLFTAHLLSKRRRSFSPLQSTAAILLFLFNFSSSSIPKFLAVATFIEFHFAFHFLRSPPSPESSPLVQFLFAFLFPHSPPSPECSYFIPSFDSQNIITFSPKRALRSSLHRLADRSVLIPASISSVPSVLHQRQLVPSFSNQITGKESCMDVQVSTSSVASPTSSLTRSAGQNIMQSNRKHAKFNNYSSKLLP
ncbi:hypothetical protein ACP275_09G141500 [Erythranthe tilingii]